MIHQVEESKTLQRDKNPASSGFFQSDYVFEDSGKGIEKRTIIDKDNISKDKNVTSISVLLSSFFILHFKYFKEDDISIDFLFNQKGLGSVVFPIHVRMSSDDTYEKINDRLSKTLSEIEFTAKENKDHYLNIHLDNDNIEPHGILLFSYYDEIRNTNDIEKAHREYCFGLSMFESNQMMNLQCYYQGNKYRFERIQEIIEQYKSILYLMEEKPGESIENVLGTFDSDNKMLSDLSNLIIEDNSLIPINQMLCDSMEKHSDLIAIKQGDIEYSYKELLSLVNKINCFLTRNGIDKNYTIALLGESSPLFIATFIGVLARGNIVLTIDEKLPYDRKTWMLESSKANVILVFNSNSLTNLPVEDLKVYVLEKEILNKEDVEIPNVEISISDPAYIFFTSGSTGRPKGILGTHGGLSHFITWQSHEFKINTSDRFSQLTALSFDVLLREILTPLVNGAMICIPEEKEIIMSSDILNWFQKEGITVIHTVPSVAKTWIREIELKKYELVNLRYVFFAGEPLVSQFLLAWNKVIIGNPEIVNLYGPSETTLAKTFSRIDFDNLVSGTQPIGKPLPNTQVIIFNDKNRPCDLLELGEIAIRTPYRTRGYIDKKIDDNKKFRINPYTKDKDDMLYFTGDLGRLRFDGVIEIVGRKDNQVKINGVRIEPFEIESLLNRYPSIEEALVVLRESKNGDKELVAYFTSDKNSNSITTVVGIRQYLEKKLPVNMIPTVYIKLAKFPLNPNGKIDRRNLPNVDTNITMGNEFIPPKSEMEKCIAEIWRTCLGVDHISILDNFFYLGGTSILAVKVLHEIERVCNIKIPLAVFFKHSTIYEILNLTNKTVDERPIIPLNHYSGKDNRKIFCIGGIELYKKLADELGEIAQVFGVYQSYEQEMIENIQRGTIDNWQKKTISELADGYLDLIKQVQDHGPFHLVGVSMAGLIAFEVARKLIGKDEMVGSLVLLDSHLPNGQRFTSLGSIIMRAKKLISFLHHNDKFHNPLSLSQEDIMEKRDQLNREAKYLFDKEKHSYPEPVTLVKASETNYRKGEYYVNDLGWSKHTNHEIEIHTIDGSHLGILEEPHVLKLVSIIREKVI